jgi:alpha-galactosidase
MLGLYEILSVLTTRFPNILFEGCASGGNRFDLGMLCFFPQIWASDNTDAWCRASIQCGYSYGYPMSVISAHVSGCPNHQTLRNTSIETRFNVAMAGVLGYECNLNDLSSEEFTAVKEQIEFYKKYRDVFTQGSFYRLQCGSQQRYGDVVYEWIGVSKDQSHAIGFQIHDKAVPNMPYGRFKSMGLNNKADYHFYNRKLKYNVKNFGDLINTVAPIHIKQDSMIHNAISKFVKMDGESEDYVLSGSLLNNHGVVLKQNYCGTGYDDEVRYYQDFSSRLFIMDKVEVDDDTE